MLFLHEQMLQSINIDNNSLLRKFYLLSPIIRGRGFGSAHLIGNGYFKLLFYEEIQIQWVIAQVLKP